MLVDEVIITAKGGNGGDGKASFKRNAQTARGGPDGGNGGNGGNLYFEAVNDITALSFFSFTKSVGAEDGISGGKQNLYGRNGKDRILPIPYGTLITDLKTNENFELSKAGERILIAKGGKGGLGNNEFKTATNQSPTYRESGQPGEVRNLRLELKLVADIGLIGLPNAGKSSLLSVLTNARPKIGNYPFTTLEPNLGVIDGLIISDIPGLIEGASKGKGLGDKFLKHVEKTKVLFHCVDIQSENLLNDYKVIRNELKDYSEILTKKQEIVLLTKSDMIEKNEVHDKLSQFKKINNEIIVISIYDEESINILRKAISSLK